MNPLLRPSRTCSAEATATQFLLIACPEKSACDSHQDRHKGIAEIPSRRSFSTRTPDALTQRIGSVKKHRLYRGTESSNPSPSSRESGRTFQATRGVGILKTAGKVGVRSRPRLCENSSVQFAA